MAFPVKAGRDLDFERLASELALQFADAFFEPPRVGGRHHIIIGADGFLAAFGHQSPPSEHQAR